MSLEINSPGTEVHSQKVLLLWLELLKVVIQILG